MTKYFKNIKSLEDLKVQFRALARKNHPDVGGDVEVMKVINCEYDALFPIWKNRHEEKTGITTSETASSTRRQFYTEWGWEGSRYDINMSTTEISKAIRIYCKEKYPTWKFSVRTEYFSGGSAIDIAVMEAPVQIFNLENCRNEHKKYLEAEKMGYYGKCGLGIDIEKMFAEDKVYWQLHDVRDSYREYFTEYGFAVLKDVYDFMQSYNYDDSDSMIDYFDCNFYSSFDIGGNKGFKIVPKTARIGKKNNIQPNKNSTDDNDSNMISLTASDYSVTESKHTKTGAAIWLVKILRTLSKDEYIAENKKMKSLKGYYSKFTHSFVFNYNPSEALGLI